MRVPDTSDSSGNGVPHLDGPIRLRRFTPEDVDHLLDLDSDPEVIRYLFREAPSRHEVTSRLLPGILSNYQQFPGLGQWAAELTESGQFVGWFSLHVSAPSDLTHPELGYRLRREVWGRGLASAVSAQLVDWAFEMLGVASVRAQTMAVNVASRRVLAKAGLRYLRTFHLDFDDPLPGTEDGEVEYSISRDQWLQQRSASSDGQPPGPPAPNTGAPT